MSMKHVLWHGYCPQVWHSDCPALWHEKESQKKSKKPIDRKANVRHNADSERAEDKPQR